MGWEIIFIYHYSFWLIQDCMPEKVMMTYNESDFFFVNEIHSSSLSLSFIFGNLGNLIWIRYSYRQNAAFCQICVFLGVLVMKEFGSHWYEPQSFTHFHQSFGSLTVPSSPWAGCLSRPRLAGLHSVPHHGRRNGTLSEFPAQPVLSAYLCLHLASEDTRLCEYNHSGFKTVWVCMGVFVALALLTSGK